MRKAILLGLMLLIAIPLFVTSKSVLETPTDFLPFYCGGRMVAIRQDPYRTQPLWNCERTAIPLDDPRHDKMLIPAPLPPYALAFFALFAPFSFATASLMWAILNAGFIALTAALLVRIVRFPLPVILAAIVPSEATVSILLGQTVPLVVLALCAAAFAVRNNQHRLTAAAIAVALIEPHIVLPAFLALLLCLPPLRKPLLAACAILAAISLIAVGPAVCLEYVAQVLPAHTSADVTNFEFQYSLTSVLWMFGVPPNRAIGLGLLSYYVALVAGIVLGARLSKRFDDRAFLVLIPPAIGLIGGVYVHAQQLVIALPAALLLAYYLRTKRAQTAFVAIAIVTLSLPWILLPAIPAITSHFPAVPASTTPLVVMHARPSDLAELGWAHESTEQAILFPPNPFVEMTFKLPAWIGLFILAGVALRMSRAGTGRAAS
jgi:hypothetical protein